jgi:hypothetical protein
VTKSSRIVGSAAMALAVALAVPGVSSAASHTTLKQWSSKYGSRLTGIVKVLATVLASGTTAKVSTCKRLSSAIKKAKTAPTPPTVGAKWKTMLTDLTKVSSACIAKHQPSTKIATAGGKALGEILETMVNAHIKLGSQLLSKLGDSSTITTTTPSTTSATTPTTTTTQPTVLAVGAAATVKTGTSPYLNVTVAQVVDPATLTTTFATTTPGDVYVAAEFVIKNTGSKIFTTDIDVDTKMYDQAGQGFTPAFYTTTAGPSFQSGTVSITPGGSATGWVVYEVPSSSPLKEVTFSPTGGIVNQTQVQWTISG